MTLEIDQLANCTDCVVVALVRLFVLTVLKSLRKHELNGFKNLFRVWEFCTPAGVFTKSENTVLAQDWALWASCLQNFKESSDRLLSDGCENLLVAELKAVDKETGSFDQLVVPPLCNIANHKAIVWVDLMKKLRANQIWHVAQKHSIYINEVSPDTIHLLDILPKFFDFVFIHLAFGLFKLIDSLRLVLLYGLTNLKTHAD